MGAYAFGLPVPIEITTLSDGGQRPSDVARGIAGFLAHVARPLTPPG